MRKFDDLDPLHVQAITHVARRTARKVMKDTGIPANRADVDDLVSAGVLGGLDALTRYDISRNTTVEQWCYSRIIGAMFDYIRTVTWGSSVAAVRRKKEAARHVESLELWLSGSDTFAIDPHGDDELRAVEDRDAARYLLEQLDERQRSVVVGYFFEGRSLRSIGDELGVTEARACQIKRKALSLMRDHAQQEREYAIA